MRPASSQATRVGRDTPSSTAAWPVVSTSSTAGARSASASMTSARLVSIDVAAAAEEDRTWSGVGVGGCESDTAVFEAHLEGAWGQLTIPHDL